MISHVPTVKRERSLQAGDSVFTTCTTLLETLSSIILLLLVYIGFLNYLPRWPTVYFAFWSGADPGIFERGGPKAIIYKTVERGAPKTLKMAFECSFQSFSYKSFANIPQKIRHCWSRLCRCTRKFAWGYNSHNEENCFVFAFEFVSFIF